MVFRGVCRVQLLICDTSFYSGFFVSGYTNCYKDCDHWRGDFDSPYFRTASNDSHYSGVAFNTNGARALDKRLISVGLRWDIYGLSCIIPFLCMPYLNISITYLSYLGLSRLTNNYEQFLLYCAIFVQNMALEHISSTKKVNSFHRKLWCLQISECLSRPDNFSHACCDSYLIL